MFRHARIATPSVTGPLSSSSRRPLIVRPLGIGLIVLALACVSAWLALLYYRLPAPTGSLPVGTSISAVTDAQNRTLVVQLWYPAAPSHNRIARYKLWGESRPIVRYESLLPTNSRLDAPAALTTSPFPVILFGHRWNGQRTQNTALAEELASQGYVVAAIDHPGNTSRMQLPDGRVVLGNDVMEGPKGDAASAPERIAHWNQTLNVWAADDLFVLNHLAARNQNHADPLYGRLNTDNVGALGHSFGGAASFALCGRDPRIHAAVNLDGFSFAALDHRTADQPILAIYEQASADRRAELLNIPGPGTTDDQLDRTDNRIVDASLEAFGGYRLYVAGTQHLDFADQPMLPPLRRGNFTGPIVPARINSILRQTVVEFFDQILKHEPSPLLNRQTQLPPDLKLEVHQPEPSSRVLTPTLKAVPR